MAVDRIDVIKGRIRKNRVYYSAYNPKAEYLHDIEDADEDMQWLVYEVERLRKELQSQRGA